MKKNNIESRIQKESKNYRVEVRPKLWDKLEKRMDDHYATTTPKKVVKLAWFRYAAAVVLLIGAGFLISRLDTGSNFGIAKQFTLEELPSAAEEDQLYKNMINFSQNFYRPLVSSSDRM